MSDIISVQNLSKNYKVAVQDQNIIKYLFSRKYRIINALRGVDFNISRGEIVGLIGPNGAGKSTVLKILTGLMLPTEGKAVVLGNDPFKMRKKNMYDIGVVFGQRTQLWWDLPLEDSFALLKKIYKISELNFKLQMDLYEKYLHINEFITQPVRQLSLGQRMKAEIAVSMLHRPKILFLDEPTIGLDVVAKLQVREFIKYLNYEYGTTVILTTHDMRDMEELCERILLISHGGLALDCSMKELNKNYRNELEMLVEFAEDVLEVSCPPGIVKAKKTGNRNWTFRIDKNVIIPGEFLSKLTQNFNIVNFDYKEKNIEEIISDLYQE